MPTLTPTTRAALVTVTSGPGAWTVPGAIPVPPFPELGIHNVPGSPDDPNNAWALTYSPAQSVMSLSSGASSVLHVKNGSGSTLTVTLYRNVYTLSGSLVSDRTVTIAAGQEAWLGAIPVPDFGLVTSAAPYIAPGAMGPWCKLGFSVTSGVTVAALTSNWLAANPQQLYP